MADNIFQGQLSLKMAHLASRWSEINSVLRPWWAWHEAIILRFAITIMAAVGIVFLAYEVWRLLWQQGYWGAIRSQDLPQVDTRLVCWKAYI